MGEGHDKRHFPKEAIQMAPPFGRGLFWEFSGQCLGYLGLFDNYLVVFLC